MRVRESICVLEIVSVNERERDFEILRKIEIEREREERPKRQQGLQFQLLITENQLA